MLRRRVAANGLWFWHLLLLVGSPTNLLVPLWQLGTSISEGWQRVQLVAIWAGIGTCAIALAVAVFAFRRPSRPATVLLSLLALSQGALTLAIGGPASFGVLWVVAALVIAGVGVGLAVASDPAPTKRELRGLYSV